MISFDMIKLYTNISHNYGIEAIYFWPEEIPGRTIKKFMIESIRFSHQNKHFKPQLIIKYLEMQWELGEP